MHKKSNLMKVSTLLTLASFGMLSACSVAPQGASVADAEFDMELVVNLPDDSGVRHAQDLGATTYALADFQWWDRDARVDGVETTFAADAVRGETIEIPLNTGELATLARRGDTITLVGYTGTDDGDGVEGLSAGAIESVRLMDSGLEIFLAGNADGEADMVINLTGLDAAPSERHEIVASLALSTLLASLEDQQQIAPLVAIALIAAAVGAVWFATCGGLVTYCAYHCEAYPSFKVECSALIVRANPLSVSIGGGYTCTCL